MLEMELDWSSVVAPPGGRAAGSMHPSALASSSSRHRHFRAARNELSSGSAQTRDNPESLSQ